jgi:hypothetical protein
MASFLEKLDFVRDEKKCFQLTFSKTNPADLRVLARLARFCRADESCVVPGDRDKTLMLEGRREVFLLINHFIHLSPEQLLAILDARSPADEQRRI